jgi:hypothetical protein
VKALLSPDRDTTKEYIKVIDDITDKGIQLKSRITLNIEKPESFHKTPGLLYALKMYITGDTGANTIVIKGISDE